jgi:hypothetical protein
VKVVDLGYENIAVGVIHRGSTRTAAPPASADGGGAAAAEAAPCGRSMATLPPDGTPVTHDFQTEGHMIVVPPHILLVAGLELRITLPSDTGVRNYF